MYKPHTVCRACGSSELEKVFDLGLQPLANDFCKATEERAGFAPLEVLYCPKCSLAQLSVVVKPEILYLHYNYVTSKSQTMRRHFENLWQAINEGCAPKEILEIGSNDGDFLAYVKTRGAERVLGMDPALNLAKQAEAQGVPTVPTVFEQEVAGRIGQFDCIVARHVFCHVDDWMDFIRACEVCTKDNGCVVIEVPYCADMLAGLECDTIYHEHTSYLTFKAMAALLRRTKFEIVRIVRFPIHGGSVALFLRKRGSEFPGRKFIEELVESTNISREDWTRFASECQTKLRKLSDLVKALTIGRKTICGFGASAKSTVWINACGLSRRQVEFICDNTPEKQGKYSPGTDIPITDEGALLREKADYAILFAWNFKDEIIAKNSDWIEAGGRFIVPTNKGVEIVPPR